MLEDFAVRSIVRSASVNFVTDPSNHILECYQLETRQDGISREDKAQWPIGLFLGRRHWRSPSGKGPHFAELEKNQVKDRRVVVLLTEHKGANDMVGSLIS